MKVELKVNDKSIQAEISEEQLKRTGLFEQLKELGLVEDKPKTGYERMEKGEKYYVINKMCIRDRNNTKRTTGKKNNGRS